jgi:GDP-L-fucose synthase
MDKFDQPGFLNVGTGSDLTIEDLAKLIASVAGYTGPIEFDTTKPDGTPRKLMDVSQIHSLGWHHKIELESGLRQVYKDLALST